MTPKQRERLRVLEEREAYRRAQARERMRKLRAGKGSTFADRANNYAMRELKARYHGEFVELKESYSEGKVL